LDSASRRARACARLESDEDIDACAWRAGGMDLGAGVAGTGLNDSDSEAAARCGCELDGRLADASLGVRLR
jgi:hypothetical protein